MDNIVNFKPTETNLNEKRRTAIKKLAHYRGEVQSKNTIRQLPDVQVGEIFWVEMDNKAYIVSDKDKKKVTIKALDENASISTGMTIFEMNKSIISKEPILDWTDNELVTALDSRICEWFNSNTGDQYYLLYGRDIHYVSLFNIEGRKTNNKLAANGVATVIKDTLAAIGNIISVDFNTTEGELNIEIWIRTSNSPAELLYLFPYDNGLINI